MRDFIYPMLQCYAVAMVIAVAPSVCDGFHGLLMQGFAPSEDRTMYDTFVGWWRVGAAIVAGLLIVIGTLNGIAAVLIAPRDVFRPTPPVGAWARVTQQTAPPEEAPLMTAPLTSAAARARHLVIESEGTS